MNAHEHIQTMADQVYVMYVIDGYTFAADERLRDAWIDGAILAAPHYAYADGQRVPTGEAEYVYSDGSVLVVRIEAGVGGVVGKSGGEYVDIEDDDDDEDDYELLGSEM